MTQFLGWWFGYERVRSIDSIDLTLAAPWVGGQLWILFAACLLAIIGVAAFYRGFEYCKSSAVCVMLISIRASILCLLLVTLAAPLVHSSATVRRSPLVYLILDDSESMQFADAPSSGIARGTRTDRLRRLFDQPGRSLAQQLEQEAACRVEAFELSSKRETSLARIDPRAIGKALVGNGKSTPLLDALAAVPRQAAGKPIAAIVVFSDFIDTSREAALPSISCPVHTVGLGETELTDVAVDLRTEVKVKRGEPTTVTIELRQSGLDQRVAKVSLVARPMELGIDDEAQSLQQVAQRAVHLDAATTTITLPFTPQDAGAVELTATVTPLGGELLPDNNVATRQITVIEDYLRILYVEYEPNWEWRQIKEVFGRDELVGRDGFRTFLASAAASVRGENSLFTHELDSPRREFFANDVLIVGDVPGTILTSEFCQRTEEFVSRFGGGLIVIAGPRFGPRQLAETPLAKMLPVTLHEDTRLGDQTEFTLQRTTEASRYPFMQLADSAAEDDAAWNNLGSLPWYQPVAGVDELAQVLAEHPTDLCDDGQTRQPLLAIRPYGRGQVVYLGFNEMWRLRKRYGDRYYQRFWSQLVYRLGMSHAVGAEKRFVAGFDRPTYRLGDEAVFAVDAFDDDYQPLGLSQLARGSLVGELTVPGDAEGATRQLSIPAVRPGRLETLIALPAVGRYAVRITDPLSGRMYERACVVSDVSVERRQFVRDTDLQRQIAAATGGNAYEISEVDRMIDDLVLEPTYEQEHRQIALWNTPMWFLLIVGLMLSEWTLRKLVFLR